MASNVLRRKNASVRIDQDFDVHSAASPHSSRRRRIGWFAKLQSLAIQHGTADRFCLEFSFGVWEYWRPIRVDNLDALIFPEREGRNGLCRGEIEIYDNDRIYWFSVSHSRRKRGLEGGFLGDVAQGNHVWPYD